MHDDNERQTFLGGQPAGHAESFHRTPSLQVHGGGRVVFQQAVPAEAMSAPLPELTHVHNGPLRMSLGPTGEVTSVGVARHIHTDSGTAGGSVMSTLRTTGSAASVELRPGDPSTRTILANALREGLIRRNAVGDYEDSTGPAPVDPQKQASDDLAAANQAAPEEQGDLPTGVDQEEEDLWQADIGPLPQPAFDSAAASLVNVVARGTGSFEDAAKNLALNAGIDPALALDYIEQGYQFHERIVARALAPMGLEGDRLGAFYEACKAQPGKLQDAIQKVVHARDMSGFRSMAAAYKASTTDLSPWARAGFQAAVCPQTGKTLVQRGTGPWVKASDLGKA